MTFLRRVSSTLLLALFVFQPVAFAWLDDGHMAVAYVAYQQLNPGTRDRANSLLTKNPYYKKWLAQVPKGTSKNDRAMMIFMMAATWPDEIKLSHSGYKNDPGSDSGDRPGPDPAISSQNIGYSDMLYHKYWHFVDEPFSDDDSPLPAVPAPDAETEIATFRAALSSNASDDIKSYDLVWLLHLVGDVHQPLHCSTRVSKADPQGDAGGNNVTICTDPGKCDGELHAFWDGLPGTDSKVTTAIAYGKALPSADSTLASNLTAATWISESFSESKTDVYMGPIQAGNGPFTITTAYQKTAFAVAQVRVALAGTRLAGVLNAELK